MVDLAGARVVAILTRAPSAGGKSRLFAALRRPPDPALLTALLLDTLDGTQAPGMTRAIVVEPATACDEVGRLAPGVEVLAQASGSLGARMASAMRGFFDRGAVAVTLVGSDLPDLQPHVLVEAFAVLDADPAAVVLGPATDGGYYLIGSRSVPPVFDGIDWGTAAVLRQTIDAAASGGYRVRLLEPLDDVDIPQTLVRVAARRTAAWVAAHL
jgi:rSAM/selenodomain-associated transferase 1